MLATCPIGSGVLPAPLPTCLPIYLHTYLPYVDPRPLQLAPAARLIPRQFATSSLPRAPQDSHELPPCPCALKRTLIPAPLYALSCRPTYLPAYLLMHATRSRSAPLRTWSCFFTHAQVYADILRKYLDS